MIKNKSLVLYHFFEKDKSYIDNLMHFLKFGYSKDIDYLIILAGVVTIELPRLKNVNYLHTNNFNHDFGGYCEAISTIQHILEYDYLFFINSSTRGPFLIGPQREHWTQTFIDQLLPDVGIVGVSINILHKNTVFVNLYNRTYSQPLNYAHVQTTAYAMPRRSLELLLKIGFYNQAEQMDKFEVVTQYELRLSQILIANGLNLRCLLSEYNQIDYRNPIEDINPTSYLGDLCYSKAYFGRTVHPYEIMFVKTNREIYKDSYLKRIAYSMLKINQLPIESTQSIEYAAYIQNIVNEAESNELVDFQNLKMDASEILNYVRGLVYAHPEYGSVIHDLVTSTNGLSRPPIE